MTFLEASKIYDKGQKLYKQGYGAYQKKEYKKAMKLYKHSWKACREYNALQGIASMYLLGEGVEKDYKKALEHWKLGIKFCPICCFNLACFHLSKVPDDFIVLDVKQNKSKGIELLKRSASEGFYKAINLLKEIEKSDPKNCCVNDNSTNEL